MSTIAINTAAAVSTVVITEGAKSETKHFIYGTPAEQVSDDKVFGHISNLESEIENLDKIKSKPKKLQAKIEGLKADIKALAELVDARP